MSERIEAQIERSAPGFRDCILARHTMNAGDLEKSNRNLTAATLTEAAANLWQLIARPVLSFTPYRTRCPVSISAPLRLRRRRCFMACAVITLRLQCCAIFVVAHGLAPT